MRVFEAPEGTRRDRVGTGRTSQTEIDATRVKRFERAERLHDMQRRVIRHHDATGTDADPRRDGGDVRDQHLGRRRGDARHVVVLGDPVAGEAEPIGSHRELDRIADRLGRADTSADRRQIQDRDR